MLVFSFFFFFNDNFKVCAFLFVHFVKLAFAQMKAKIFFESIVAIISISFLTFDWFSFQTNEHESNTKSYTRTKRRIKFNEILSLRFIFLRWSQFCSSHVFTSLDRIVDEWVKHSRGSWIFRWIIFIKLSIQLSILRTNERMKHRGNVQCWKFNWKSGRAFTRASEITLKVKTPFVVA